MYNTQSNNQKLDENDLPPEVLAEYIADRCKGRSMIIDALCGIGANLIQFAKKCEYVIGIEKDTVKIKMAKDNLEYFNAAEKVELI
jgi:tRNA/tmRNA/rRNA uracil-C5-methylase (TrmA/RlmC/RlmD family)